MVSTPTPPWRARVPIVRSRASFAMLDSVPWYGRYMGRVVPKGKWRRIMGQQATLYRMVMDKHLCPSGLKAKALLEREGFTIDDHWLRTRAEPDAYKEEAGVKTTPQILIDGKRIGGYDDLRRFLGKRVRDPKARTYRPVIAVFAMTALMALAASYTAFGTPFTPRAGEWFIAFSMCVLAIL